MSHRARVSWHNGIQNHNHYCFLCQPLNKGTKAGIMPNTNKTTRFPITICIPKPTAIDLPLRDPPHSSLLVIRFQPSADISQVKCMTLQPCPRGDSCLDMLELNFAHRLRSSAGPCPAVVDAVIRPWLMNELVSKPRFCLLKPSVFHRGICGRLFFTSVA